MANVTDDQIAEQFRSVLGRDPRRDELDYLKPFLQNDDLSIYEVGQYLQSTPEYQNIYLKQSGQQYSDLLGQSDQDILGNAQDYIRSDLFQAGRRDSSAYLGAYSQAAKDLAQSRQNQLAAFYGGGFQGIGQSGVAQGLGTIARGYGLRDERRERQYDIEDYYRNQDYYNKVLSQQRRGSRRGAFGRLGGAGLGAGIGALLAAPTGGLSIAAGAGYGALVGSQAGGLLSSF